MNAIRILRGCGASGVSLEAGNVYAVPAEVSDADADILCRLGKAEEAQVQAAPVVHKVKGAKEEKRDV